jgi:hypothetical protein
MTVKGLLLIVAAIGIGCSEPIEHAVPDRGTANADQVLVEAFESRASNVQVEGHGIVVRILADDLDGGRHQRFILRLKSGQTLLVAHNIDRAPRVTGLRAGDEVWFNGEYEWNPQGGVLHWTHHDPDGRHPGGWLKHDGRTYR